MRPRAKYIRWFEEIKIEDVPLVGGKNASLGEMYRELSQQGVRIPNGFAVTAEAYWHVLRSAGVLDKLVDALAGLDKTDVLDLARRGERARDLILGAGIPDDLWSEIKAAYDKLCEECGPDAEVAVRSSATAEDLPSASFAGQHETFLNVHGYHLLKEACIKCLSSLFTDRGISYRIDNNFDHFEVALSIGIMKMVRSDLATSGVMFTLDTETGFRDVVFVTASYGLGENIVQGAVNPDEFYVFKPTFRNGHRSIIKKVLGSKEITMIYGLGTSKVLTRNVEVPKADRRRFCITDDEVMELAGYAIAIEDHFYSRKLGDSRPLWTSNGQKTGKMETYSLFRRGLKPSSPQKAMDVLETYYLDRKSPILTRGSA